MTERIDQIEKYYSPIEKCEKWASWFFWICAILSIIVPYSDKISSIWLKQIPSIAFILAVLIHSTLSAYSGFFLIPTAETLRRKQLLSNSFDVPLTPETTQGYYNNELAPSIARLGACVLENSFFGKNVCLEMAKIERGKMFVYFLLWITAITLRSTDLNLVLTLTQVLFSGNILFHWIKLEILRSQNENVYEQLYSHFLNRVSSNHNPGIACILHSFASYESAKASAAIKQSSKIFNRLNPRLSAEWEEIRNQLGIEELGSNQLLHADPANSAGPVSSTLGGEI